MRTMPGWLASGRRAGFRGPRGFALSRSLCLSRLVSRSEWLAGWRSRGRCQPPRGQRSPGRSRSRRPLGAGRPSTDSRSSRCRSAAVPGQAIIWARAGGSQVSVTISHPGAGLSGSSSRRSALSTRTARRCRPRRWAPGGALPGWSSTSRWDVRASSRDRDVPGWPGPAGLRQAARALLPVRGTAS